MGFRSTVGGVPAIKQRELTENDGFSQIISGSPVSYAGHTAKRADGGMHASVLKIAHITASGKKSLMVKIGKERYVVKEAPIIFKKIARRIEEQENPLFLGYLTYTIYNITDHLKGKYNPCISLRHLKALRELADGKNFSVGHRVADRTSMIRTGDIYVPKKV